MGLRLGLTLLGSICCGVLLAHTMGAASALSCVEDVLLDKDGFLPADDASNPDENDIFPELASLSETAEFSSDTINFSGVQ